MTWSGATNIAVLDQGQSDADSTTYTTNSFALPASTTDSKVMVLLCTMVDGPGAATPQAPTWTRTTGGAVVATTNVINDSSAGIDYRVSIKRLNLGEGGFTDSLVATSDATPDCFAWWIIALYNVAPIVSSIIQTNSVVNASGTSNTLTLAGAVAKASNLVVGMSVHNNGNATTAGQTRIGAEQANAAPAFSSALQYRNDGTNTLTSSWATSAANIVVMAEIRTMDDQVMVNATT